MKLLVANFLFIAGVAAPLLLVEWAKNRTEWLRRNHDWLSIVIWFLTLAVAYLFVLPRFSLGPNPRLNRF
jgi:hypothetical protein